jgi:hypothetical protein
MSEPDFLSIRSDPMALSGASRGEQTPAVSLPEPRHIRSPWVFAVLLHLRSQARRVLAYCRQLLWLDS